MSNEDHLLLSALKGTIVRDFTRPMTKLAISGGIFASSSRPSLCDAPIIRMQITEIKTSAVSGSIISLP